MRICLLTDQELESGHLDPGDWPCDPRPHLPDADWTVLTLRKDTAVRQVVEASRAGYDVFFNLCDGAWDEGRVGIEVVQTLEWLNVPFTGAATDFYEPTREAMKRVCRAWGIDTPAYVFAHGPDGVDVAARTLRFPLFVKHPSSYASCGLTPLSRVTTREELRERAAEMIGKYGAALIEEFIDGIECTVLVGENAADPACPFTYQPIQYAFPEGETFKHYDLKWIHYGGLDAFPVRDPDLDRRLRTAAGDFFQGMRGSGFGRCDVRVDADGRPFMLEINPNCGIYYPMTDPGSADLCLAHDPAGHSGFTERLVRAAFARHQARQGGWRVLPRPGGDYGIFTTRPAQSGEVLLAFEEQPHHLVTRAHVEAEWDERRMEWFRRYAWPLTDEVWVTWSEDPEEWRPLNHSCDPSAWLEGLDVVARRALTEGEEVTLDYATFYDEHMTEFTCVCGAEACRGVIRGDDYTRPFMERYGPHLSDHIRRRRTGAR